MSISDFEPVMNLSGTALAIGVLLFFARYFMRHQERTEIFISTVIDRNTKALNDLREVFIAHGFINPNGKHDL